jgi:ABC-type arginine transport system ATPase subunit/GNAT superfamily N-acetyltransferase
MKYSFSRRSDVVKSPRVLQIAGLFDVPLAEKSEQSWDFEMSLPDEWNVGLIVGPSGAGKSTMARELFESELVERWEWPSDRSILDGFPAAMGIKDITELLSSVGFSSPPAWVRPFHVLSNGEQFRVHMARTLAEMPGLAVVDEFTSVVDRVVAQIGSSAIAKTVRRRNQKFVAVTCHYDVADWLDPDWIFEPHTGKFQWRSLQGRPTVELEIHRGGNSDWPLFRPHHYLSGSCHTAAPKFIATLGGRPIAFNSYLHFPHPVAKDIKIGHRLVVLPDYQGLGIGLRFEEWMGQYLHEQGWRYHNVTAHPALIAACLRSPRWKLTNKKNRDIKKKITTVNKNIRQMHKSLMNPRVVAVHSFQYVPAQKVPTPCSSIS